MWSSRLRISAFLRRAVLEDLEPRVADSPPAQGHRVLRVPAQGQIVLGNGPGVVLAREEETAHGVMSTPVVGVKFERDFK